MIELHRRPISRIQIEGSALHLEYASTALMLAGSSAHFKGYIYNDGSFDYIYLGNTFNDIRDYRKLAPGDEGWIEVNDEVFVPEIGKKYFMSNINPVTINLPEGNPVTTGYFSVSVTALSNWTINPPVGGKIHFFDVEINSISSVEEKCTIELLLVSENNYNIINITGNVNYI